MSESLDNVSMTIEEIEETEPVEETVEKEEAGEEAGEEADEEADEEAGEEEAGEEADEEEAGEEAGEEEAGEEEEAEEEDDEEENLEENEKKINDKINEWIQNTQKSEEELKILTEKNEGFLKNANKPNIMRNIAVLQSNKQNTRGFLSSLNSQNSRAKTTTLKHFKMKLF